MKSIIIIYPKMRKKGWQLSFFFFFWKWKMIFSWNFILYIAFPILINDLLPSFKQHHKTTLIKLLVLICRKLNQVQFDIIFIEIHTIQRILWKLNQKVIRRSMAWTIFWAILITKIRFKIWCAIILITILSTVEDFYSHFLIKNKINLNTTI